MKRVIGILGSTGSIGKTTLNIISKNSKNFEVKLLSTNKNIKLIKKQIKKFKVKNIIIHDLNSFNQNKDYFKKKNIDVFHNIDSFQLSKKIKFDYVMCSISGLKGLEPTLKIIKFTKNIAIANKEAIICGWNLIKNELKKLKTNFLPVDSEHFSIWSLLNKQIDNQKNKIEMIYLTASGGPFFKLPLNNLKNIKPKQAIKHPNWKMGKKISVDSSTLMNKIFEVIEAKNIFDLEYKKINIFIHPKSYIHGIVKFNNGLTKLLIHDTSMKIPIFNTIFQKNEKKFNSKKINIKILNNLELSEVDNKKFPVINLLKNMSKDLSLFETVIVSANDELVDLFLKGKIKFTDISKNLIQISKSKEFLRYKKIKPKNIDQILNLNNYVRLKIKSLSV